MSEQLEKGKVSEKKHNLRMEGRAHLMMDGVLDVDTFDDGSVTVKTALGPLAVEGEGLHIKQFDADGGNLVIEGKISALVYLRAEEKKRGLFGRR